MTTTKKTVTTLTVTILISLATLANCAPRKYSAAPLSGQVVDKATGQPIAGAYVVAVYGLNGGLEGTYVAPLHYMETRTDKEGRFRFEGFTDIPVDHSRAPRSAIVMDYDPLLFFFADGYLPKDAAKNLTIEPSGDYIKSPLDGIVMKLEPMSGNAEKDARKHRPYISGLSDLISAGYHNKQYFDVECSFIRLPQTLNYLLMLEKKLDNTTSYRPQMRDRLHKNCDTNGE